MKKTLLLVSLFISSIINAQTIPNAGFETWITDTLGRLDPDNWECSNLYTGSTSVVQDVGHTGTGFSVKMVVVPSTGVIPVGGSIDLTGEPFSGSSRPSALKGYWKANNTNGDFVTVHVYMYNSSHNLIADKSITTSLFSSTGWTAFSAPLSYTSSDSAASYTISISFFAHGSASGASYGNVDDLSFDFNSGIEEAASIFSDCYLTNNGSVYNLNFSNVSTSNIKASIIDISGREVFVITDEKFSSGKHSIPFDASSLSAGIYSCLITDGKLKTVVKMRVE